jgi:folate-dependent tRNA-U54 methylase TrmFO/GidA
MGVIMKYPTIDSFVENGIEDMTPSNMIDVIVTCISQIYDKKGEEVFESKDSTQAELIDFVEQLNTTQFQEVQKFFDTMPKLQHEITVENPKTKKKSKVVLSGLSDFFG